MAAVGKLLACMAVLMMLAEGAAAQRAPETLVNERCRDCHGAKGQSSDPDFPKLAGQNADYLTRQMANFKTGVRPNNKMLQQMADLSGEEMRGLALYFSAQELVPEVATDPELVQLGRHIYFNGSSESAVTGCVTCHGPQGRGGMYLPRLAGQHAQYLETQLHAFLDYSRSSPDMVMHTVIENITETEINAVAYFLSGME